MWSLCPPMFSCSSANSVLFILPVPLMITVKLAPCYPPTLPVCLLFLLITVKLALCGLLILPILLVQPLIAMKRFQAFLPVPPCSPCSFLWFLWNWFYVVSLSFLLSLFLPVPSVFYSSSLWNWEMDSYGFPLLSLCSLCPYSFPLFLFSHSANPLFNRLDMYLSLLRHVIGHINSYSMICLFLYRLQTIST